MNKHIFFYLSDIHLEFHTDKEYEFWPNIEPKKPNYTYNLICAGDIGLIKQPSYWLFMVEACKRFDQVFVVLGNHEYYGCKWTNIQKQFYEYQDSCKLTNLMLLENTKYEHEDYIILGTTLWSNIPQQADSYVTQTVNDYRQIQFFSTTVSNQMNQKATQFLGEHLKERKTQKPMIVVTHHAPTLIDSSDPLYEGRMSNFAFANQLDEFVEYSDVWIYGHTHWNKTMEHPKLKTNQLGYNWDKPCVGFNVKAHFMV